MFFLMLTQNDLRQIELIVDRVVERKLEEKLIPIRREIREMQKDIKEIKKSMNIIADHFDREALGLYSRVDRIERHLKLPPN